MTNCPNIILLFSGKRKSGKDYICETLKFIIGEQNCLIIRISEPLKGEYAKLHGLNLTDLMSDGPYKEKYRLDMISWSDKVRLQNPGYFCNAACENAILKPLWVVSDVRRKSDITWFKEKYGDKIKLVRVSADLSTRVKRGWNFTEGVDDVTSECDLDDFIDWDIHIHNNTPEELEIGLKKLQSVINDLLSTSS